MVLKVTICSIDSRRRAPVFAPPFTRRAPSLIHLAVLGALLIWFSWTPAFGQSKEQTAPVHGIQVFEIDRIIERAVGVHPTILAARGQYQALREEKGIAELQRYPTVSVQSEMVGVGNGLANSAGVSTQYRGAVAVARIEQPLWTWGRLTAQIDAAESNSQAQAAQVEDSQLSLALAIANAWQSLVNANGRIESLTILSGHMNRFLGMMERRVEAKVSAPIELDLIHTRIAQLKIDMAAQHATRRLVLGRLEQLLGEQLNQKELLGQDSIEQQVAKVLQQMHLFNMRGQVDGLAEFHPIVRKARLQAQALKHQYTATDASAKPEIYARSQYPISGGSSAYVDKNIYLGLRYTPGAGFSSLLQARGALARAEAQEQVALALKRDVKDALLGDLADLEMAQGRLVGLQLAKDLSAQIVGSYERQFIAGRRSWQEVMNAVRETGDYLSGYADAQALLLGGFHRYRIRSGQMTWPKVPL